MSGYVAHSTSYTLIIALTSAVYFRYKHCLDFDGVAEGLSRVAARTSLFADAIAVNGINGPVGRGSSPPRLK